MPSSCRCHFAGNGITEMIVIDGDNLHTDILAGIQAGLETGLDLSGFSSEENVERAAFRPNHVFPNAAANDVV